MRRQHPERMPLKRRLAAVRQKLRSETIQGTDTANDPIIYHYTDPGGLIGILTCGRLWATSIRHLEDESELLYAETVHEEVLGEIKAQHPSASIESRLAGKCHVEPRPYRPGGSPLSRGSGRRRTWMGEVLDRYVACFSTRNDLVNQWKEYAKGGAGFAIGFDRRELQKAVQPRGTSRGQLVYLAKVRYSVEAQKRELMSIFGDYCATISASSPSSHVGFCAEEIVNYALALRASLFKHPKFEPENEWRIIIEALGGRSDLCFRSSADKVIPYIETARQKSGRLPVVSVTIGPAMDHEASARGVQSLLDAKGYRGVKVSGTEILPSLMG